MDAWSNICLVGSHSVKAIMAVHNGAPLCTVHVRTQPSSLRSMESSGFKGRLKLLMRKEASSLYMGVCMEW